MRTKSSYLLVAIWGMSSAAIAQGGTVDGGGASGPMVGSAGVASVELSQSLMPLEGSSRWQRWLGDANKGADIEALVKVLEEPGSDVQVGERKLRACMLVGDIAPRCREIIVKQREGLARSGKWFESVTLSKDLRALRITYYALWGERVGVDEATIASWLVGREKWTVASAWCAVEWCLFHRDPERCRSVLLRVLALGIEDPADNRDLFLFREKQEVRRVLENAYCASAAIVRFEGVDKDGALRNRLVDALAKCSTVAARLQSARLLYSLGRADDAKRLVIDCPQSGGWETVEMRLAVARELGITADELQPRKG